LKEVEVETTAIYTDNEQEIAVNILVLCAVLLGYIGWHVPATRR
jgi:hypothetical protein